MSITPYKIILFENFIWKNYSMSTLNQFILYVATCLDISIQLRQFENYSEADGFTRSDTWLLKNITTNVRKSCQEIMFFPEKFLWHTHLKPFIVRLGDCIDDITSSIFSVVSVSNWLYGTDCNIRIICSRKFQIV